MILFLFFNFYLHFLLSITRMKLCILIIDDDRIGYFYNFILYCYFIKFIKVYVVSITLFVYKVVLRETLYSVFLYLVPPIVFMYARYLYDYTDYYEGLYSFYNYYVLFIHTNNTRLIRVYSHLLNFMSILYFLHTSRFCLFLYFLVASHRILFIQ